MKENNPGKRFFSSIENYAQWLETILFNNGEDPKKLPEFYDTYTCWNCALLRCPFRWDEYNTDGDCLALK